MTLNYGEDISTGFSTYEELTFICEEKKPMFLIKMCERFEDDKTRVLLTRKAVACVSWPVGTPLPPTRSSLAFLSNCRDLPVAVLVPMAQHTSLLACPVHCAIR